MKKITFKTKLGKIVCADSLQYIKNNILNINIIYNNKIYKSLNINLIVFHIFRCIYNNFKLGLVFYLIAMLVFSQGIWRYQVPMGLKFIQNPMLEMVKEATKNKQPVVFYRFVSFAALFYGKKPIHMRAQYMVTVHRV